MNRNSYAIVMNGGRRKNRPSERPHTKRQQSAKYYWDRLPDEIEVERDAQVSLDDGVGNLDTWQGMYGSTML
jgi:hypothetical protein